MKRFFSILIVIIIVINFGSPIIFAVNENENTNITESQEDKNKQNTTNNTESQIKESTYDKNNEESNEENTIIEEKVDKEELNNDAQVFSNEITKEKSQARMWIDEPTSNYISGKSVNVVGWFLSNDKNAILKIYIDGKDTNTIIARIEREDVLNAIPGYGGKASNPKPGFAATLDLSKISYGNHTIKYAVLDEKGIELQKVEKNINIDNRTQARMYLDTPTGNYIDGKSADVSGWFLCSDASATLKIYIDGKDTNAVITRVERNDVLNAIPGYGGKTSNPKPGFKTTLDLSKISYGNHTIKYAVLDGNGIELQKIEKAVTIDSRTKSRMWIDEPTGNYIDGKSVDVSGWFLCSDASATLKIYIDGKDTNEVITRVERNDVLNAIPGYGGKTSNPKPGFKTTLDLSKISYGNHTIRYAVVDGNGIELQKIEKTVTIDSRTKSRMWLDTTIPSYITGKEFNILGWYLCSDSNAKLKIYIDGNDAKAEITRVAREDVLNAIPGYGGKASNPKPGFIAKLNLENVSYGKHKLRIEIFDGNEMSIFVKEQDTIIDSRTKARMYVDSGMSNYIEGNTLNINGWYLSNDKKSSLKLYIDNEEKNIQIQRFERQDVLNAISGYGGKDYNPTPGYKVYLDISNYAKGISHKVKLAVVDSKNTELTLKESEIVFYSDDKGKIYLDYPSGIATSGNNISFGGWAMAQTENSQIKVFLNGSLISPEITRFERNDVINAIKGYGTAKENPKPGFEFTLSTKDLNQGSYTVEIQFVSNEGKVYASINKSLRISRSFGIDVSTHQGNIAWNEAKNYISYAILRIGWKGDTQESYDRYFDTYYNNCIKYNIPVGIYVYNYGTSVESARNIANKTLDWLNGRTLDLPIFFDIEEKSQENVNLRGINTEMAKTFCSIIQSRGYRAGIYGNKNFLTNYIDMRQLENDYVVWVAQYNDVCTYSGRYNIWQYSSSGRIPGINGNVDCNIFYGM